MALPVAYDIDAMSSMDETSDVWLDALTEFDDHSDGEESSLAHTSDSSKSQRKKRIRPNRKHKSTVIIPRLFKRDIRRYYATMMANVHNSNDPNLLAAFLRTYAVDQIVLRRHGHTNDHRGAIGGALPSDAFYSRVFNENKEYDLCGVSSFVRVMSCFFALYPDQICRTENVRIVSRAGEAKSRVEYDFLIAYNLLYDVHPISFVDHLFEVLGTTDDHDDSASDSTTTTTATGPIMTLSTPIRRQSIPSQFDPFAYFYEKVGYALPRRTEPLPITMKMQAVMHLDESRRMCRIEMSTLRCAVGAAAAVQTI